MHLATTEYVAGKAGCSLQASAFVFSVYDMIRTRRDVDARMPPAEDMHGRRDSIGGRRELEAKLISYFFKYQKQ